MADRGNNISLAPFPAASKIASGLVDGTQTEIVSISFSNKIVITISQGGKLAQWIHVPLDSMDPNRSLQYIPSASSDDELLPLTRLTPSILLGGGSSEREVTGRLIATQIASAVANKNPDEARLIVVGLGLEKADFKREAFFDLVDLFMKCI